MASTPAEGLPARIAAADWIVMSSIWWENAPLVAMEAFKHGRPVICGNGGGMAEAVRDGVDGIHFPIGDPGALAAAMRRAIEEEGLWARLVAGIQRPRWTGEAAEEHLALYRQMLAGTAAAPTAGAGPAEPAPPARVKGRARVRAG
jgi:glycosyltransferase involved in cell wall biosynthesis